MASKAGCKPVRSRVQCQVGSTIGLSHFVLATWLSTSLVSRPGCKREGMARAKCDREEGTREDRE
eukprot:scaffold20793_cov22-Tisochrysis_lutea.AAC.4